MKKSLHALAAAAALALGLALVPTAALAAGAETDGILVTLSQPGAGEISLLSDARSALDEAGLDAGEVVTAEDGALTLAGLDAGEVVTAEDGELTLEARPADGQTDEQALAAALELPGVTDAQLNYVYQIIEPVDEAAPKYCKIFSKTGEAATNAATPTATKAVCTNRPLTSPKLTEKAALNPRPMLCASTNKISGPGKRAKQKEAKTNSKDIVFSCNEYIILPTVPRRRPVLFFVFRGKYVWYKRTENTVSNQVGKSLTRVSKKAG